MGSPARPGPQRHVRDRRDARQRFAAEAQRRDRTQILDPTKLACRVAFERQHSVLGQHPFAVVLDANELLSAELYLDGDPSGAGIKGVLDQLLDRRGRALDDLARRNLIGQLLG